jgi:hypothetical protein
MAKSTLDIFSIKTVPPTYSWDNGIPNVEYTSYITNLTAISSINKNVEIKPIVWDDTGAPCIGEKANWKWERNVCTSTSDGATWDKTCLKERLEYVGYAPYMSVTLSSAPGVVEEDLILLTRTANFGDYYNSDSNFVTSTTLSYESFCHVFVMPGVYEINFQSAEYVINFKSKADPTVYVQPDDQQNSIVNPLSSQWYNFTCNKSNTKWNSTGFQQAKQLTWRDASGPCIEQRLEWSWDQNVCNDTNQGVTWDLAKGDRVNRATWNYVSKVCTQDIDPKPRVITYTKPEPIIIRVLEIPPTAYLEVSASEDRTSPLLVRLSARKTLCGSFPIEKIVWDLGDGSPLLTQRRWSNTLQEPFVYSGELQSDYEDPRNYDVIHTYTRTPSSGYSFYPSITAYSSSTGTSDCCATIVGPLKLPTMNGSDVKIIQTELTEHGKVMLGQVDEKLAVWRCDK